MNEKLNEIELASVWNVESIEDQPDVTICAWSIREAKYADGSTSRHIVGAETGRFAQGRVSSAIHAIDLGKKTIITKSGRCYSLEGSPGYDIDAAHVWGMWKKINNVVSNTDVTNDIAHLFLSGEQTDEQ